MYNHNNREVVHNLLLFRYILLVLGGKTLVASRLMHATFPTALGIGGTETKNGGHSESLNTFIRV
jgi:hypothetical protein